MKRIWIISDTHIGCRSNSVLWLNIIEDYFFNFFIPLAKKEYKKGDVLFHLGDVFDNRQNLNLAAQHLGIKIFDELKEIFDSIHIIVGNHDIMKKNSNDIASVDCLKYMPKVNVYKEPELISLNKLNLNLLLLPWRRDKDHEKETLNSIKSKVDYLFCHTETQGVKTSHQSNKPYEGGNDLTTFKRFKKIYSGHIHYRQNIGNMVFVGNPYQMTRSDMANEKGVYILNLEEKKEYFIENNYSPIYLKYYLNNILNKNVLDILEESKDNFVDIYIPTNYIDSNHNINVLLELFNDYAKIAEPKIFDNILEEIEDIDEVIASNNIDLMNISNQYVKNMNINDKLKTKLNKTINELYNKVLAK